MNRMPAAIGGSLDDFLKDRGSLDQVRIAALKQVVAIQLAQAMADRRISKAAMARQMGTSRAQLDRVLDATGGNVTIETLARAAHLVGRELRCDLV